MSLLPLGNPLQKTWYYIPPLPTPSPLLKGGEGRGEGGSYTRMPCLFGALLVTLYQNFQQRVFEWEGGHWGRRQPPAGAGAA